MLFWSRRPYPHPLWRLHLGFNMILTNPRLISCYDVLKVFITICTGKQFLTFQHGSLCDHQPTNTAQTLHWRYTSEVFVNIWWHDPMLNSASSAIVEQLNDDFHESQHELSQHCHRLLVCDCVQAWDLHWPIFCPLYNAQTAHSTAFGWYSTAVCLVKQFNCLCKIFTKFTVKLHTPKHTRAVFFKLFHFHFVTKPTNSLCLCCVQQMDIND
jgi:hypothetical protein